jgi:hypothetical protein
MPIKRRLGHGAGIAHQTAHKELAPHAPRRQNSTGSRVASDGHDDVRGLACVTHTAKLMMTKVRTVWNHFSLLFEVDLICWRAMIEQRDKPAHQPIILATARRTRIRCSRYGRGRMRSYRLLG